jgi:hypothetical protein
MHVVGNTEAKTSTLLSRAHWYRVLCCLQAAIALGTTATKAGTVAAVFGALGVGSLLSMSWLCKRYKDTSLIATNLAVSANVHAAVVHIKHLTVVY